ALPIGAGRCPEGEEAEGGDDRRQDEGGDAEPLEDVRPGGYAPPREPRQRQGDQNREGSGAGRKEKRVHQCRLPAGIEKDLRVPGKREPLRGKDQRLAFIDRYAQHHDQGGRQKGSYQREDEAAESPLAHTLASRRPPIISVRATSAIDIKTRKMAMAAAKGMFDW